MHQLKIKIFLGISLFQLLLSQTGFAQRDKIVVQIQLRRLEERLRYAQEIVTAYGNRTAKDQLRQANEIRKLAVNALRQNRLVLAENLIKKSLRFLELAIRTTLTNSGNRMADRLEDLMKRTEHALQNCANKEAERLYFQARNNQDKGLRALNRGNLQVSLEHMRVAYFQAERALKLCQGNKLDLEDNVLAEKERFENLLEQARQAVEKSENEMARNQIAKALHQAEQADQALAKRQFNNALTHYYQATRLLWRGIELARSSQLSPQEQESDQFQREVDLLEASLENLSESLSNGENKRSQFLYQRAIKLKDEAQIAYQNARKVIALKKIRMAQNAVGRALEFLGRGDDTDSGVETRTEEELERLQTELERVQEKSANTKNPQTKQLIEMAEQNLAMAEKLFQEQQYKPGLERILLAHQFLNWTDRILRNDTRDIAKDKKLESRFQEFDQLYEKCAQETEQPNQGARKQILDEAMKYRQKAETAIKQNQNYLARAAIEMAITLVKKCDKLTK